MVGVVSPIKPNENPKRKDTLRRENIEQIVSPEQVWELLTQAQQQRIMQVMIQVGRSLVQHEAKEGHHESH
jgi:hypothetical protein